VHVASRPTDSSKRHARAGPIRTRHRAPRQPGGPTGHATGQANSDPARADAIPKTEPIQGNIGPVGLPSDTRPRIDHHRRGFFMTGLAKTRTILPEGFEDAA